MSNLTNSLEDKKLRIKEIEGKCKETTKSLSKVIAQKDEMIKCYNEGISLSKCFLRKFGKH